MNILVVLLVSIVVLVLGYLLYGRWLANQWGVDPSRKTPSHELEDGVDYVPAKAPVLKAALMRVAAVQVLLRAVDPAQKAAELIQRIPAAAITPDFFYI